MSGAAFGSRCQHRQKAKGQFLKVPVSRWRPPSPHASPYITADGYRRLETELKELWQRRALVTSALTAAAAEGDRSENAEYIYRKKQRAEIDRRVRYLSKRIPSLKVAEGSPGDRAQVFFGATIELENVDTGEMLLYRIVGPDETDANQGWISIDSPIARAVLKKRVDDEFVAELPAGAARFAVLTVDYR